MKTLEIYTIINICKGDKIVQIHIIVNLSNKLFELENGLFLSKRKIVIYTYFNICLDIQILVRTVFCLIVSFS